MPLKPKAWLQSARLLAQCTLLLPGGLTHDSAVAAASAAMLLFACSALAPAHPTQQQQGSSLSSTTCELLLCCGDSIAKKKLPKSVTVAALKLLCGRLFKLPPDQLQLLLVLPGSTEDPSVSGQQAVGDDIGLDDTKQLSYWDVADGCAVQVVHVDPDQQRQQREVEEASRKQEHEQRMAQQLQQGEALRSAAEQ